MMIMSINRMDAPDRHTDKKRTSGLMRAFVRFLSVCLSGAYQLYQLFLQAIKLPLKATLFVTFTMESSCFHWQP